MTSEPIRKQSPMTIEFTEAELEAYLEEALDTERAAQLEKTLRDRPDLLKKLAGINSRRDSGVHTLGAIWRRHQLAVPSREALGGYLLGILSDEEADYIKFRVEVLKCPFTIAKLRDLEEQNAASSEQRTTRKKKYLSSTSRYFSHRNSPSDPSLDD